MNPKNLDNQENLPDEAKTTVSTPSPQKRSYKKREVKSQTIATLNEQIEEKKRQIGVIQAEIETLTAQRNNLYFDESEMMGLIDIMADPEKAMWLAEKLEEYNHKRK
jgi:molecular chaperone GrpE (heat shock protein)